MSFEPAQLIPLGIIGFSAVTMAAVATNRLLSPAYPHLALTIGVALLLVAAVVVSFVTGYGWLIPVTVMVLVAVVLVWFWTHAPDRSDIPANVVTRLDRGDYACIAIVTFLLLASGALWLAGLSDLLVLR